MFIIFKQCNVEALITKRTLRTKLLISMEGRPTKELRQQTFLIVFREMQGTKTKQQTLFIIFGDVLGTKKNSNSKNKKKDNEHFTCHSMAT